MGEDRNSRDDGQRLLDKNDKQHKIHLLSVIGEVEGHETLSANTKTTKYEHVLPKLAEIEDSKEVDGLLLLLNTVGGDVESGLAIAEMVASLSIPTVSLVLGGSHSIGVPLAVSADYSFIVPSGTMVIHPVRLSGTVIGAPQTYDYFKQMQDRIIGFICEHCFAKPDQMERLMMNHVFAAQDCESGTCRYHTAPNGTKPHDYFHGPDCCTASGHRIISLLPTFFYAENGKDFYIGIPKNG